MGASDFCYGEVVRVTLVQIRAWRLYKFAREKSLKSITTISKRPITGNVTNHLASLVTYIVSIVVSGSDEFAEVERKDYSPTSNWIFWS